MDVVKGATPGQVWISAKKIKDFQVHSLQTIIAGLEAVGSIFGENVNKEIAKLVAQVQISGLIKFDVDFISGRVRERFCRGLLPRCLEGSPCCGICTRLDRANPHIEILFWLRKTIIYDIYDIPQLREGVKKLAEGGEEGAQEIRWVRLKLTTIYFRRKENVDIEFCGDKLLWIQLLLCFRNIAEQLEKGLTDFGAKDYSELDWMWFFHKYLSQCAERPPYSELNWMWYPPFIFASIKYIVISCPVLDWKRSRSGTQDWVMVSSDNPR